MCFYNLSETITIDTWIYLFTWKIGHEDISKDV